MHPIFALAVLPAYNCCLWLPKGQTPLSSPNLGSHISFSDSSSHLMQRAALHQVLVTSLELIFSLTFAAISGYLACSFTCLICLPRELKFFGRRIFGLFIVMSLVLREEPST